MLSSEKSSLEKLQLKALARIGSFTPVRRDGERGGPYEGLKANLQPFQSVRGLSQVSLSLEVCHSVTHFFSRPIAKAAIWVTGAREYLDTLESIMRSPRV
jgi:hypothetical protein